MTETMTDKDAVPKTPFLVEHRRVGGTGGDFVPAAHLVLTPALRTSGLWAALPPEEIKDLLLLLTFLTPNGWVRPTLSEMADAMGTPQKAAQDRLRRLARRQWRGGPVAVELAHESGLGAYAPGRHLLAHEQAPHPAAAAPALMPAAGREAVLAYSRARYARTRAEVEAEINERMGWAPPAFEGDAPEIAERKRAAYGKMTDLGMPREQALDLLGRFDLDRVERQVAWIGSRNAKNPARFLVAAIENDYDAPLGLRARADESEAGKYSQADG